MATAPKRRNGRPASISLIPGTYNGNLEILGRVHTKDGMRIRVMCHGRLKDGTKCGKVFLTKTQYLTRKPNPQTHCGCQTHIEANPYKYEKVCWQTMHLRCEYTGHVSYSEYGGRGIKIDPEWSKNHPDGPAVGFQNFIRDIGPCPHPHHWTVDRIDSDGHYTKSNVRWASPETQASNQRRHKSAETRGKVLPLPWEEK